MIYDGYTAILRDTSYFRCRLLKRREPLDSDKAAPINSGRGNRFTRHSCSLRPTYQGVHVACLRERRDSIPSEVFDQCYPSWIVTRIRRDSSHEQGELVRVRECRRRRSKRHLNHVPIGHNFRQCLGDFGAGGAEKERHQVLLPRRVESVKESVNGHSRVALWKYTEIR